MKRSNSAPMIPEMIETVELKPPTVNSLFSRRGLSTSNVSLPGDIVRPELSPRRQPLSLSRINSPTSRQHRVEQLKKEELIDERQNEREIQEQILLTKTCSDMKLNPEDHELKPESMDVQISPTHQSFASPASPLTTRMRSRSLTPTSPSSARTFSYRRSCSPVLRPSSLCFGQKRKRDQDPEDMMDISPSSIPNKKLHLGGGGYASPLNLSPCVSPLMSVPHSFISVAMINSASRKSSSTQSESTPLSSPSSLVQSINPFAINYDSGNCEHWQSSHSGSTSGSTCSSAGQSPPGITVNEEQKMIMDSGSIEVSTEAPTPLSPKGLQFRQKPFNLLSSSLPSPIPSRTLSNGSMYAPSPQGPHVHIVSTNGVVGGVNSHMGPAGAIGTGIPLRGGHRGVLKPHPLHHDKHLSPFNSDLSHPHPHPHPHSSRPIKVANRSRILVKADPLRPSPVNPASSSTSSSSSMEHYSSGTRLNTRLNSCSSPLAKLSMSSSLEDGSILLGGHGNNASSMLNASGSSGIPIHQLQARERHLNKRRTSETSTDSREESFMESDNEGQSIVGSLEESVGVHLCSSDSQKPFDTKVLRTHS